MCKFKEEEFYSINIEGKTAKVICVGVGTTFSFFSPVEIVNGNAEIDLTKVWVMSNAEPTENVCTRAILPVGCMQDGKEN